MSERPEGETIRRVLCPLHKDTVKALEQTGATLGMQSHFDRAITHISKQFGVQPRDLKVVGEYRVNEEGEEEFVRAFGGFPDPSPNPEEKGKLISFDEALQREWQPPR